MGLVFENVRQQGYLVYAARERERASLHRLLKLLYRGDGQISAIFCCIFLLGLHLVGNQKLERGDLKTGYVVTLYFPVEGGSTPSSIELQIPSGFRPFF